MKKNLPITNHRVDVKFDSVILSTTNLKGALTYINQDFLDISGFSTDELIGMNHNIVRHPEMPPAAFESLWGEIKQQKPWMGMVKNRCKNGDYYWVDAYVMPIGKNGNIEEYQSVRSKPDEEAVKRAETCYQHLLKGKSVNTSLSARLGIKAKLTLFNLIALLPVFVCLITGDLDTWLLPCFGLSAILLGVFNVLIMKPMDSLLVRSKQIYDNPLMRYIYSGRDDEFGQLALGLKMQKSQLGAILGRLSDATLSIKKSALESINISDSVISSAENQLEEIESSTTAMGQMFLAVEEISEMANKALTTTSQGIEETESGKQVLDSTINSINNLTQEVNAAGTVISRLAEHSVNIGNILDVIKGIAEQTNLLALNAAIEAARAGDQGRGFAVVADEVRTLAGRTQESTEEIEKMIERIQEGSKEAEKAMAESAKKASDCQNNASLANQAFENITKNIDTISEINHTVASATEEQAMVSKEVNSKLESINATSKETMKNVHADGQHSKHIADTIEQVNELVEQFRKLSIS